MIPRIIHYCWFGKRKKTKLILDCLASWKKLLPDYEIIEWNEKNCTINNPFALASYKFKKYAFVSDYVRLQVLYEHGGIYLDTDMMLIKNLDSFLTHDCFFGAESPDFINCAIIGAKSKNSFIKSCIGIYEKIEIDSKIDYNIFTIPRLVTKRFRENFSYINDFSKNVQNDFVTIYNEDFFYPMKFEDRFDGLNYKKYIKEHSFSVHLWNNSWVSHNEFHYFRNRQYLLGYRQMLVSKEIKNLKYFKKIISCLRESFKNE